MQELRTPTPFSLDITISLEVAPAWMLPWLKSLPGLDAACSAPIGTRLP